MHEMRAVATDDPVAWCVSKSVCLLDRLAVTRCALQKRLCRSRSCLVGEFRGTLVPISHTDSMRALPNYFGHLLSFLFSFLFTNKLCKTCAAAVSGVFAPARWLCHIPASPLVLRHQHRGSLLPVGGRHQSRDCLLANHCPMPF